jgi:hypothetical protein
MEFEEQQKSWMIKEVDDFKSSLIQGMPRLEVGLI